MTDKPCGRLGKHAPHHWRGHAIVEWVSARRLIQFWCNGDQTIEGGHHGRP